LRMGGDMAKQQLAGLDVVQAAQPTQAAPTETATITPPPTVNPDILAQAAALRGAAESQATAASLQVTIAVGVATDDETRRREVFQRDAQTTAEAIETERAQDVEREQVESQTMHTLAAVTVEVARTTAEREKWSPVVASLALFVVCLTGVATFVVIVSGKRYPQIEYIEPAPDHAPLAERIIIQAQNSTRYPFAGDVCTDDELEIIADVVNGGGGLTVRALEDAGMSSERWRAVRAMMISRGLLERKNDEAERVRVVPTADGWAVFNEVTK